MQRRFSGLIQCRPGRQCALGSLLCAQRRLSKDHSPGERMDEEDPAQVLRQLQEDMRKRSVAEGKNVPPAPPRRSGKTLFFVDGPQSNGGTEQPEVDAKKEGSDSKEQRDATSGSRTEAHPKPKESRKSEAPNPFLQKLSKMESDTQSSSFPTYDAAAEERRKKIDAKIKEERSKMLIFRDVGMDLDKPILSRDVFLIFKYFRYGIEFAVDNELERMLRYFNEHAMNELKIIQDSKLMRGPPTLSRKRRHAPRQKAFVHTPGKAGGRNNQQEHDDSTIVGQQQQPLQFQISSLFPQVRCANTRLFCPPDCFPAAACDTLSSFATASQNASSFASFFPPSSTAEKESGAKAPKKDYNAKDDSLFTVMSPSMFRRPAVVIYSQLGQKFGSLADTEWRRLAYASICPGLLPYVPMPADAAKQGQGKQTSVHSPYGVSEQGRKGKDGNASRTSSPRAMPIDVISLRSADVYKYNWVQKMYVNRFAKSLSQATPSKRNTETEEAPIADVNHALIASTTFVGSQLLEPFYTTLGLRNYLLPHVMLVDHEGVIRWLSGGCPDADEQAVFPSLLRQLEAEYYKASK